MVSKNLDILQTSFMEALSSAFLSAFASVRPSVAFVALRRFGWQRNELSPPTDRWRRELDGWIDVDQTHHIMRRDFLGDRK